MLMRYICTLLLLVVNSQAQTQIDWNTQVRNRPAASPIPWSRAISSQISPGSNTITFGQCPIGLAAGTNIYITGPSAATSIAVASATNTSAPTPITVTTVANHGLTSGSFVFLSGMSNPQANGPFMITSTGAKTITLNSSNSSSVGNITVVGATNATPIVVTANPDVTPDHGFQTGDVATITGATGNTAANGTFAVTRISATQFSLNGSIGNGVWVGGGVVTGTYSSSSGIISYGPEAVPITSTTCSSGGSAITFTASNAHLAGVTLQSATAGVQEGINAAVAASVAAITISSSATWQAGIVVPPNFTIQGVGLPTITLQAGMPAVNLIGAAGTTGVTTTSTTSLPVANRSFQIADAISVASSTGIAADDYVQMHTTEVVYNNVFDQVLPVYSVLGNTLTFKSLVYVPLDTTQTGDVIRLNPVKNIQIRDLILDGTNNGSAQFNAGLQIFGINLAIAVHCSVENVRFLGWARDGALTAGLGFGNRFVRLNSIGGGTGGFNDIAINSQTRPQIDTISSLNSPGFGVGFNQLVDAQPSNIFVDRPAGRGIKFSGAAYVVGSNFTASRSLAANGVAITAGTYRTILKGVIANGNRSSEGIWSSSQDNQYNIIDGAELIGNATQGLIFYNGDCNSVARNIYSDTDVLDLAGCNTIQTAVSYRSYAHNSGNQSIPNNVFTALTFDTNDYDVGPIHSTSTNNTRFTIPAGAGGSTVGFSAPLSSPYLLVGQGSFASSATGQRILQWFKNGATSLCQTQINANSDGGQATVFQATCPATLVPGDYVELRVYQDSGGALAVGSGVTFGSILRY